MFRNILVPVDGSDLALSAARSAAALAVQDRATVVLLHVRPPSAVPAVPVVAMSAEDLRNAVEAALETESKVMLDDAAKIFTEAGVAFESVSVGHQQPWEAIVQVAGDKGCDLIIMGSHGRGSLKSLVLGSQTHKVLSHTKVPVLVYR